MLSSHKGKYGGVVREFQVNYNANGNTFSGVMPEEKLTEFLASKAGVSPDRLELILAELRRNHEFTLSDVEIRESEAPAMGLDQAPSDY